VVDPTCRKEAVEAVLALELPHAHRMFYNRTIARDTRPPILRVDRAHINVQLRREPSVQTDFLGAEECPAFNGAQIGEWVLHGSLELVRELARQQYPGNVRFDQPHHPDRMRICRRSQQ
jgi:hypothetical protein